MQKPNYRTIGLFLCYCINVHLATCCTPSPTCTPICNFTNDLDFIDGVPTATLDASFDCAEVGATAMVVCPAGQQLFSVFGTTIEQCAFGSFVEDMIPNTEVPEIEITCTTGGWVSSTGRVFTTFGCSPCPSGWPVPYEPIVPGSTDGGGSPPLLIPSCSGIIPDPVVVATDAECVAICAENTQCFASYFVPANGNCYVNYVNDLDCADPLANAVSPECSTAPGCSFTSNTICPCPAGNILSTELFTYLFGRTTDGLSDGELFAELCCAGLPPFLCPEFSPVAECT